MMKFLIGIFMALVLVVNAQRSFGPSLRLRENPKYVKLGYPQPGTIQKLHHKENSDIVKLQYEKFGFQIIYFNIECLLVLKVILLEIQVFFPNDLFPMHQILILQNILSLKLKLPYNL